MSDNEGITVFFHRLWTDSEGKEHEREVECTVEHLPRIGDTIWIDLGDGGGIYTVEEVHFNLNPDGSTKRPIWIHLKAS